MVEENNNTIICIIKTLFSHVNGFTVHYCICIGNLLYFIQNGVTKNAIFSTFKLKVFNGMCIRSAKNQTDQTVFLCLFFLSFLRQTSGQMLQCVFSFCCHTV